MRSTMQRQLTRRPITSDDQRIVVAAAAELRSLDARTVSDFEAEVTQVLSRYLGRCRSSHGDRNTLG